MSMTKALEEIERFTPGPGEGYNLVVVDTFEPLGESLDLVANFETREDAEAAKADKEAELAANGESGLRYYVYGPSTDG